MLFHLLQIGRLTSERSREKEALKINFLAADNQEMYPFIKIVRKFSRRCDKVKSRKV